MTIATRSFQFTYGTVAFNAINEAFTAHGSWTRVEDVTSGTQVATIWRSPVVANSPQFHICVYRPNANPTANPISIFLFEEWNTTTKSFSRPAPSVASGDVAAPAADGSYGGGEEYVLLPTTTTYSSILHRIILNTGTLTSSFSVADRGVIWNTYASGSSTTAYFASIWYGAVESVIANDPVAVAIVDRHGNGGGTRWTRYPTVSTIQAGNWGGVARQLTGVSGTPNGGLDRLFNHRAVASRVAVGHASPINQAASHGGLLRGQIPNVLEFAMNADAPLPIGDSMTVGVNVCDVVAIDHTRSLMWLMNRTAA